MQFTTTTFFLAAFGVAFSAPTNSTAPTPTSVGIPHLISDSTEPSPILAASVAVATTCVNSNLNAPCLRWTAPTLPMSCTSTQEFGQQDSISSIKVLPGIRCTFYSNAGCSGNKFTVADNTFNDLRDVSFNDIITSFDCRTF